VRSAAGDAAARQAAEVKQAAQEAKDQAGQAKADAGQAKTDAGQAKQNNDQTRQEVGLPPAANQPPTNGSQPGGTGPGTAPVPRLTGNPTDFRIAADAPIDANTRRFRDFTYSPPPNKTVSITDAILQNPRGDIGTLRMGRGTPSGVTTLTEYGLGNFRDLDEHWVQPIVLRPGERLVVSVSCQNPPEKGNCTPSVFFTARIEG